MLADPAGSRTRRRALCLGLLLALVDASAVVTVALPAAADVGA